MKILIPTNLSQGTQVLTDKGEPVDGVRKVVVTAEVDQPVRAEIDLACIETTHIESVKPDFMVGGWQGVVGLIMADGRKIDLATGDEIA